jgi:predicted transcriptional regulator
MTQIHFKAEISQAYLYYACRQMESENLIIMTKLGRCVKVEITLQGLEWLRNYDKMVKK